MSEQGGFKESNAARPDANRTEAQQEAPFQAERELRPAGSDQRVETKLQALSPDRPVIDVKNLNRVDEQQMQVFKDTINHATGLWSKTNEPLRNVYDNMKRQELTGEGPANGDWSKNYISKVEEVLRDNMKELSGEVPFRVAFPVQSFLPDSKGVMKGETLYALFPPLQANIHDKYISFPLHSTDPSREAQLRRDGSLATSISSDEQVFRFKVNSLMGRRDRAESA